MEEKNSVSGEILRPRNAIMQIRPVIIPRYDTACFWYVREYKRGPAQKELKNLSMCSCYFSQDFYNASTQWAEISPK